MIRVPPRLSKIYTTRADQHNPSAKGKALEKQGANFRVAVSRAARCDSSEPPWLVAASQETRFEVPFHGGRT